jgi:RNA-binding protein YlmH
MNIYQHFRVEEREFIDQVLHWRDYVEDSYSQKLTDFLDPREQQIIQTIVGTQSEVRVEFFGGLEGTERKRALIFPEYFHFDKDDFQIQLFEINYPNKFITLEHPKVLGSLMSLGLKREKFGDILFQGDRAQFFVVKEISDYIKLQLTSIGRASITLSDIPFKEGLINHNSWIEVATTVSSLRLDTVISAILNLSRQKSQDLVKQGRVRVNWTTIENPAFECGVADMISVRGFGRSKVISIEGRTKKEKWRIIAGKQK